MAEKKKSRLTLYICIAIVLAIVLAWIAPTVAMNFAVGGEIFLDLLKMIVVPLVVVSVMSGILGLGDVRKLGKPGGAAILFYLTTTVLAVTIGLVAVNVIRPGKGFDPDEARKLAATNERASEAQQEREKYDQAVDKLNAAKKEVKAADERLKAAQAKLQKEPDNAELKSEVDSLTEELAAARSAERKAQTAVNQLGDPGSIWTILKNLITMLFTDNLFESAINMELLPLIVFSIIFAGMLTTMGSRVQGLTAMIAQINDALLSFILLLMNLAPIGIFCLVTARFGQAFAEGEFLEMVQRIGSYMATVLIGLAIHAFVILPLIMWIFTRRNPYRFIYQMSQALLTAFSTASSSATLPITMECANVNAGVSKKSTEFVLPLGATINMDGTALYEAVAAIFIANSLGVEMDFTQQLVIAVTATLAAIGAAGIPEAGLITMLIVLNAVGLPVEGIGLILAVDWLLDRFRTAVNVFGDSIGSAVVEKTFPADEPAAAIAQPAPAS